MREHPVRRRTTYELRNGKRLLWRGRGEEMILAVRRLERKFGRGAIRIHVVFREGVLIAVHVQA